MSRRDYGDIIKVGDALYKYSNPETTMCTPTQVYEQVESLWDKWREENTPFIEYVEVELGIK